MLAGNKNKFWIYHGLLMWFSFSALMLVQIFTHRYLRHKWNFAIKIHITSALMMVIFSAFGSYFLFNFLGNKVTFFKYGYIHVILGFFSLCSLLINSYLGLKAFFLRRQLKENWNYTH